MTEQLTLLSQLYQGWDTYQEQLLKAVAPLSREQMEHRTAPQLRSIGENITHIVSVRAGWLHFVLGRGGEDMVTLAEWGRNPPAHSAAELVDGLKATWQVIQEMLSQWTLADLAVLVEDTDDDGEVQTYTRQWVIWHLIEHDLHHGGELSFTLGTYGLSGIDI
jgi:uncharacterized damage-inducible protein DinB